MPLMKPGRPASGQRWSVLLPPRVPRRVKPDGRVIGTIGGGCAEAEARLKALTALDDSRSFVCKISMSGEAAANEGMACGGNMDVFIQVV